MVMKKKIYIASKVKHAPKWRDMRRCGIPFNSSWIDLENLTSVTDFRTLWKFCIQDVKNAAALILYVEEGEIHKGTLVEVGVALAHDIPIYIVGEAPGTWVNLPKVYQCDTIETALEAITGER